MAGVKRDKLSTGDWPRRQPAGPTQISRRGWRDILLRVKDDISNDAIGIVAAGVAFYTMLAIFPALAALVSLYGLLADPAQLQQSMSEVSGVMPPGAKELLMAQLKSLAASSGGALTISLIVSILLALWSASKAMGALITALNIVYHEQETRGFIKPYVVSLALTLGAMVFAVVTLFLIVVVPAALGNIGLPAVLQVLIRAVRWVLLAAAIVLALGAVYHFAPSRHAPQWRWLTPGAVVGAVLWLFGSALFSLYVESFGSYNKIYGSFAAIIILMLWFNLSAFATLIGAEINSEMEHQAERDSMVDKPRPHGGR